jgi:hypothetical protein
MECEDLAANAAVSPSRDFRFAQDGTDPAQKVNKIAAL